MKKLISLFALISLLVAPISFAADSNTKIGIINIGQVLQESNEAKNVSAALKKKFKPRQEALVTLQESVKTKQDKMNRDKAVLSKKELQALTDAFETDKRELQRKQQAFMQDLQAEQNALMRDLTQKLNKVVESIAEKEGYDLIMQRDQVVFSSTSIDITDKVLVAFNKK